MFGGQDLLLGILEKVGANGHPSDSIRCIGIGGQNGKKLYVGHLEGCF